MPQWTSNENETLALLGQRLADLEESHFEERISGIEARMGTAKSGGYRLRDLNESATGFDLKNIVIMARASVLSYRSQAEVSARLDVEQEGSHSHGWLEDLETDTQAFWYRTDKSLIFVFRGTSGAVDVATDVKQHPVQISIAGQSKMEAHQGFAESAKSIWPAIKNLIDANPRHQLWFAGHSLGGALATLTAYLAHSSCKENRALQAFVWVDFLARQTGGSLSSVGRRTLEEQKSPFSTRPCNPARQATVPALRPYPAHRNV